MSARCPHRRGRRGRRSEQAFTLIEVMVSLAILALSLTVISQAQQASMRQVLRSKMMTVATLLAREKMVDLEEDLFKEGFSDFEEEEKGDFDEEGFSHYKWVLKFDKIELPKSIDGQGLGDEDGDGAGSGAGAGGAAATGMGMLGGKMMSQQFEMFRNVIENAIRRVSLKVTWKEGRRARAITVVAYFTDPRKIDAAGAGISAITSGSQKTGTSATGSPTLPGTSRTPTPSAR
jgi:general secretion pathway protein I